MTPNTPYTVVSAQYVHSGPQVQRREINFRHVVEPLNLLILMAEMFFLRSACFLSFLFSWLL